MKRLLALFIMLAVLGMCAPSYGYILIYKAQIYGKALDLDNTSIEYGKVKAYVVVAIADGEPVPKLAEIADGCDGILHAEVIFYDRYKGPKFYAVDDPYMQLITPAEDCAAITINEYDNNYQCNMVGKLKPTNIGLEGKKYVAKELAGSMLMNGTFFDLTDIIGAATVTATLDTKLTKSANTLDVESEVEAFGLTMDTIIGGLEAKGFCDLSD